MFPTVFSVQRGVETQQLPGRALCATLAVGGAVLELLSMSAEQASGAPTAAASDESKVDLGRGPGAGEGVHNNPQSTKYQDGGESRKVAEHVVRMFLDAEEPPVPADAEVELVLFNYLYNVMHKVTVKGRGSYALRVSNENAFGKTLLNARSEMAWLSALHASQAATGVVVPRPVPVVSGEYVVEVKAGEGGSTRDRRCVMVEWLPGALCYKVITPELCEQAGKVMARLHEHASSWTPPEWFTLQPLEMLMCGAPWEAASEEAGKAPSGASAALKPLIVTSTAEQVETYKQAYALSKETLALCEALGHGCVGTIHADLHFGNMLVREDGTIQVIDFDDCGHGPFAQDMGITLFYLQVRSTRVQCCVATV